MLIESLGFGIGSFFCYRSLDCLINGIKCDGFDVIKSMVLDADMYRDSCFSKYVDVYCWYYGNLVYCLSFFYLVEICYLEMTSLLTT